MNLKNYILFFFFIATNTCLSQIYNTQKGVEFSIKVVVEGKENKVVIKNAEVSVNGITYNYSPVNGYYLIKAKVGDELRVSHQDFETIYYTIKSNEEIRLVVEGFDGESSYSSKSKVNSKTSDNYFRYIDSVKFYQKKDIEKSLFFIEEALKGNQTKQRNAATYAVLGGVYRYWKQYDLAINNYKLSIQIHKEKTTLFSLAKALFLNQDYAEAEEVYNTLQKEKLNNYDKIIVFEGLADIYLQNKNYNKAITNYKKALTIAEKDSVTSKITDLNSKIAEVFAAQGKVSKATKQFESSLNLAKKENTVRALKEEEKVADFFNANNRFDEEIKLRKESLKKTALHLNADKTIENESDSITSQKINYKIGKAYIQKEAYKEAIPFLKNSIKVADDKKDIVVQKDATRRLSEVYASVGEYDKALKSYQGYVELVDELYVKKEQEIQQANRFSKKIADNQNRIASLEKDKELAQSKISLAYIDQRLSEESNQRQRLIIYSLIGGFLLMCLLAYFMFRNIKQQKLANNLLALKSMRSQMNPHFIFNALNSVNSFIAVNDERNANRYLSEFSVLMRSVLENSDEDFIPLSKEIELLELYTKLEHNRFKEKFDYSVLVDESIDIEQFSIPPMLLQPYIENAIWHGLRYKKEKGFLEITITKVDEETVKISIKDDGIGRKKSQEVKTNHQLKQKSKGMSTIKNRISILNSMYRERITVQVSNLLETGEGTVVTLILKKK